MASPAKLQQKQTENEFIFYPNNLNMRKNSCYYSYFYLRSTKLETPARVVIGTLGISPFMLIYPRLTHHFYMI